MVVLRCLGGGYWLDGNESVVILSLGDEVVGLTIDLDGPVVGGDLSLLVADCATGNGCGVATTGGCLAGGGVAGVMAVEESALEDTMTATSPASPGLSLTSQGQTSHAYEQGRKERLHSASPEKGCTTHIVAYGV